MVFKVFCMVFEAFVSLFGGPESAHDRPLRSRGEEILSVSLALEVEEVGIELGKEARYPEIDTQTAGCKLF